jgi:hypothetical protein
MRNNQTLLLVLLLGAPLAAPGAARAQVDVRVQIPVPTIRFEVRPHLVTVSEGVEVVPDYPEEVFYRDGYYWHRTGARWYRAPDHRGGWVLVDRRVVPVMLVGLPPGKYKHFKYKAYKEARNDRGHPGRGNGNGNGRGHGRKK